MRKITFVLLLLACILSPSEVLAWGTTGHRVIAEIAERNLNKNAKAEVDKLLDNQHLAYWANWADFIKSDTTKRWENTHKWHYVNAPAHLTKNEYVTYIQNNKKESLYNQIAGLVATVKDKSIAKEERKEALIFLIHLVGDFHQPMHTGRGEDLGGNKVSIKWFGRDTNLHSLWDSALVDSEKYSYTEYATVLDVITKEEKEKFQNGTLEDWFYDSHCIANEVYDATPTGSDLSYQYNYRFRVVVEGQLQKGGLRLAKILNDLF